jgi:hypothetical protein
MNNYNYLKKYRKLCYQDRLYIYEREKNRVAMQNLPWQEYERAIKAICDALYI